MLRGMRGPGPYHDASEQAHALPAVSVGHHVTVADGEEGDGDKPHGSQKVTGHFLLVMVPGGSQGGPGQSTRTPLSPSHSWDSARVAEPWLCPARRPWLQRADHSGAQSDTSAPPERVGVVSVLPRAPWGKGHPPPTLQHPFQPSSFARPPSCCSGCLPSLVMRQRGPGEGAPMCAQVCTRSPSQRYTQRQMRTWAATGARSSREWR